MLLSQDHILECLSPYTNKGKVVKNKRNGREDNIQTSDQLEHELILYGYCGRLQC